MADQADIFETHYREYCRQIGGCDLEKAAGILGIQENAGEWGIPFLGETYGISGNGIKDASGKRPGYGLCVILAKYVLRCPETAYHDPEWVAFRDFKREAAMTNVNFFSSDTETAILKRFEGRLDRLVCAGHRLGGQDQDSGAGWDFSMAFDLLPRIRLLLLFNDRDEEFPAQCRVLFEKHAEVYLDPESLAMSGAALAKYLQRADRDVPHES